jgi:site-specific recombinase XerD
MRRVRTSLLPAEWTESDRRDWATANAKGQFLRADGRAANWKHKTRRGVEKRYGLWLGYLKSAGALVDCQRPSERATRQNLEGYVGHLQDRGNASTTIVSCIRDVREAIRVMEPDADLSLLSKLLATLSARQSPTRHKQAQIMHPDDLLSGVLAFLDAVPGGTFYNERSRAGKYRDGLIVALFAARPIRLANMTEMTIGQQLIEDNGHWLCRFAAHEMKDDRPLAFSFPGVLVPYLETYLALYRPRLLNGNDHCRLWISSRGRPMSEQSIYWNTSRLTEELFGRRINPHLFRDCAASAIASDDPEHVLASARILGHASLNTTERYYNQSQMTAAIDAYHAILADIQAGG